jgi:hypothetical protein
VGLRAARDGGCVGERRAGTMNTVDKDDLIGEERARLEAVARARASQVGASQWHIMEALLAGLKSHSLSTYTHSLRVGLYASTLASAEDSDSRLAFYGGSGHDLGKIRIPLSILETDEFGDVEREALRAHPASSYELLAETFPMAALVAGIHHTFQRNGYGIDIDEVSPVPLWGGVRDLIVETGRRVADCDFYDAWTTRPRRAGDVDTVEEAMELHGIVESRISWLIDNDLKRAYVAGTKAPSGTQLSD